MDLSKLSDDELRSLLKQVRQERLEAKTPKIKATDDMSGMDTFFAGMGKAGWDIARGLGQLTGQVSRQDMDEVKARDADLMDTGAGLAGNIAGNVIPALAMPASTIPRALATGAAQGFAQPVGTNDSRTMNTAMGGMFGAAVPAVATAYRAGKALVEPAIAPQRTAARILEQFADDPQAMRLAAAGQHEILPNSSPTLAQVAQQPGISTLERSMSNQPGPMQAEYSKRMLEQNAARTSAMNELAGEGGKLEMFKASRAAVGEELYVRAMAEVPGDTKWIKGEVSKLMQRPAFVSALKEAQEIALNQGIKVSPKNPENATQLLHFTKMALDDQIETVMRAGGGNKAKALIDTKDKLVSLMESKDFSPSYREARDTFKQMSKPVNEMELAAELRSKLIPAAQEGMDAPANLNFGTFSQAMRARGDDIAKVMSPEGKKTLENVFQDLQRAGRAESLGKAKGSPTTQFLTTQNLMRQIAGPAGLPQGFMERVGESAMRLPGVGSAAGWLTKGTDAGVQAKLAELLMDPKTAAQAFALINKQPGAIGRGTQKALPYLPALGVSGMFSNRREQ